MTVATAPLTPEHIPLAVQRYDRWFARARRPPSQRSWLADGPVRGEELLGKLHQLPGIEAVRALDGEGGLIGHLAAVPLNIAPDDPAALRSHPRSALVPHGGHALPSGRESEVLRALYVRVAERLVADRRLVHYVDVPAGEVGTTPWSDLGFGRERVHGLMAVKARGRQPRGVEGLAIRRAGPGDLPQIGRMAAESARRQRGSATFQPQPEGALAALRVHYAGALADTRCGAWIASRRGEEIGMVLLVPAEPDPVVPASCAELVEAYVEPAFRGEGISRVLLATALAWAYDGGHRYMSARWPSASPLAAGHFPAIGFRPVAYRLSRTLDARLTGAPGTY
ncbi:Acetyltransferase (GNAT) family protein [Actinacidiphila yanglinensis]|uniref:Acetyltransferase (GNAT) family protein n=1 Tax=Actinacidiphila yanglinensis TaxID=310779 RepID=A0A1H6CMZ9_9ACTN|nr:GNAT family N-acetyltransferase [Actinacidiphila yanglinensis]SEG74342.1 Acetyltransferase (GNAT) family protein [Actinacidiphila yanglinensis]